MSVLEVSHVSKSFGSKHVLSDINLSFDGNKIYGLLGRNGAGKSTLLSIITDRIFADSGEVKIDSEDVSDNDSKLGLMYLMSEANLYADGWTLTQILKDSESLYGGFNHELADHLIKEFGLDINQKFGKLSTGYNSIFKLILALCLPVKYVLLDEPVLGLDANHRELFYSELIQSYSDNPRTFIVSTHLIEPEKDVEQYTKGLNVIGHDMMGTIRANYVYGDLDDRILPDTVQLSNFDLQKLFIFLTNQYEGSAKNEDK